jgi:hypothetical protein
MLTIIFSWLVLFAAISLIGKILIRKAEWFEYFWVGLIAVIGILQIWSLFSPVNILALSFILGLSGISFLVLFRKGFKLPKIDIRFVAISAILLFVVSYFASVPVGWPDTQGYHLNAVKWANLYPVVPGLANLHSRLGFNSSFFLFASMIDNWYLSNRSSHIALSLMASVLLIEFLWIFFKSKNEHIKIFILVTFPVFVGNIVKSGQISSLSYDFALLIVILAICIELLKSDKTSLLLAGALSILLVTVKLSGAVFSLVVTTYLIYQIIFKKFLPRKSIYVLVTSGFVLLTPYIVRNVILSGWPLYPLPLLKFDLPWSVPTDKVGALFETIKAWAILPGATYQNAIRLPVWKWFPGWFVRNMGTYEIKIFLLSIIYIATSAFLGFFNREKIVHNMGLIVCGLAAISSILYLFLSAPDFRFGGIFFWVLFAVTGSFLFVGLFERHPKLEGVVIFFSIIFILYVSWPPSLNGEFMLKSMHWEQTWTNDQTNIIPRDGSNRFRVFVPGPTGSCGNSELPCTPEINSNFKEIVPGDISKGFAPTN